MKQRLAFTVCESTGQES